jgi:hypothetical protein
MKRHPVVPWGQQHTMPGDTAVINTQHKEYNKRYTGSHQCSWV